MTTEELLRQLKTKKIVIFGAGFVAEMFYQGLELHHAEDRVAFCVVTRAETGQQFHGRPVCSLNEARVTKDMLLCAAVHESAAESLEESLRPYRAQTVWIYPNLFELLYGKPVRSGSKMPLSELLAQQDRDECWIAVRYAAVRDYLAGRREYPKTRALYLKALSLHCGEKTAAERTAKMERLASSMAENGFREDCPVRIDEKGRVIDGLHRIACAAYLNQETVPVEIYPVSDVYDRVLGEKNRLPEKFLSGSGFSGEEMRLIREAWDELFPEVSVILPVYNVGEYLDVCMESLERQTFTGFEILMINDGSTDGSRERCGAWAKKDPRIRFIDKENEGVAASRNLGVRLARGKYLAFVDPDDWLEPVYLEKLYKRLEETGADFAECDIWRYDNRTGKKIYRSCGGTAGKPFTLREHMKYGPTATYKSLSRRSMWTKYHLRMPDCAFESPAVYALIVALSGRVESIPEALYYYRRFRENSLIENGYALKDGSPNHTLGLEAMDFLIGEFRRLGLYEEYRDTLEGVVKYRLNDILAMQFHRRTKDEFDVLIKNYRAYLAERFPDGHNEPYLTFGGYNLNRVLTHMNWLHDPSCRFNFSSIVSICGEHDAGLPEAKHKNRYRELMIRRERDQSFWRILREVRPEYLFLDMIEERFDLISVQEGYLTKSDAYDGLADGKTEGRLIGRFSEECADLWKNSARAFVRRIREIAPDLQPVIVETLLCENVGDVSGTEPFPEVEEIRKTNRLLSEYYSYLEKLWPEAEVIRYAEDPLRFTDRGYEYGAVPSHLNELLNRQLAQQIEDRLKKKRPQADHDDRG